MPTKTNTSSNQLKTENEELRQKLNHLRHRLGGLRYHVVQESTQGNALSPVEFVRLVDNIIDEA